MVSDERRYEWFLKCKDVRGKKLPLEDAKNLYQIAKNVSRYSVA